MIFFLDLVQNFDLFSIVKHNIADMGKKGQKTQKQVGKVDLRNVMLSDRADIGLDEYIIRQKRNHRRLLRGEAGAELIEKALRSEGIDV